MQVEFLKVDFSIFAALAEYERALIGERTKAGLAPARVRGRKGGRKYTRRQLNYVLYKELWEKMTL